MLDHLEPSAPQEDVAPKQISRNSFDLRGTAPHVVQPAQHCVS